MSLKRVEYQERAVENLIIKTEKLFKMGQPSPILVFKAPTGSGKTLMIAKYIQNLCTRYRDDICFVWLSLGKGDLHLQSRKKLENVFQGFPRVSLLSEDFFGSRAIINRNEVVVVNWESINEKDEKGNYTNILMRDSEKINFRQVLANTREIGRKIILIIDESHYGATTERAYEIRNEINPFLTLEMSATPKIVITAEDVVDGRGDFESVKIKDVIKEGMIKEQIIINEGLDIINESTFDRRLLEAAYRKRLELKRLYESENSVINPLVIIQLPNSKEGEIKKRIVLDFLKEKGVSDDNIAIWLDDTHINLDNISDNNNQVGFLLFKQAIDTGWDCPRAQILLRFREIKSFVFEKQTLGRILRMPEQKHYKNSKLNRAYVYTDYEGNVLKIIDRYFDFPEDNIRNKPVYKKNEFKPVTLRKEYIYRKKKNIDSKLAKELFFKWADENELQNGKLDENHKILIKKGFDFDTAKLTEKILSELDIDTEYLENKAPEIKGKTLDLEIDEERTELYFRRILRKKSKLLGNKCEVMFQILRECIYEFFFNYILGLTDPDEFIVRAQKLFLLNYDFCGNTFFNKLIDDIINIYKNINEYDLYEKIIYTQKYYVIPDVININTEVYELVNIDKYYYSECYLQNNRSNPEKAFEEFIKKKLDKIEYWLKNGDRGSEYFSLVYEIKDEEKDEVEKQEFYPDFIIKFIDGRIGIFEVKDDNDNERDTKAKAEKLYNYIQEENQKGMNLFGGIVTNVGTDAVYIKLNNKEKYSTNYSDWIDLETLI